MFGRGPWAKAPGYHRCLAPRDGEKMCTAPGCSRVRMRNASSSAGESAVPLRRMEVLLDRDSAQILLRLRPFHLQSFERIDDRLGDDIIAKPFAIGRDDVPGRMLRAALVDGVLVSRMKLVPSFAHFQVGHRKLPMLGGIIE